MKLNETRKQWEKGLEVKCVLTPDQFTFLVVLETPRDKGKLHGPADTWDKRYHCHRYFEIGSNWGASVDGQNITLERVWKWLENPCARACV